MNDAVAATWKLAIIVTEIRVHLIAVVTLLALVHLPIAAGNFGAIRATCTEDGIRIPQAVVTLLTLVEDPVSASGLGTIRATRIRFRIRVYRSVVTLLTRIDDAVAAEATSNRRGRGI